MLADNIIFLKKNYPVLYDAIKKNEEGINRSSITLEDTRSNKKTLKLEKDGKFLYLHSKYDPEREAESVIDKLEEREEINNGTHVIFYGLGLGYHIDAFIRRFPDVDFSIYEPSIEVFNYFLENKNLKKSFVKKMLTINCEFNQEVMDDYFSKFLSFTDKRTIIVDLPIYKSAFTEQYNRFWNRFLEVVKSERRSLNVNYYFQKRWILNSVTNFKKVLNSPNILMQDKDIFENKIAILVSAGPSLNFEIENLKMIKEKGLAYIFSVGSSINTLIYHDIYPDAICTYDPEGVNQEVFRKINEKGISSIPMIFGSSISYEVLEQYQGPKYHMITTQDTISNYLLNDNENRPILLVKDAPSIALVTMELLNLLGFDTIILVGQNFAYFDDKRYADGIDYQEIIDSQNNENLIRIKDVLGSDILTNGSFDMMRKQMESYIKTIDSRVINTTIGGARIEYTEFEKMETVLQNILRDRIVDGNEFEKIISTRVYDKDYMKNKMNKMLIEFTEYKNMLFEIMQYLQKINELLNNTNVNQAQIMYEKLDKLLSKVEANDFFKVIALPANRVGYKLLVKYVQRSKNEKNEVKKIRQLIPHMESFINSLNIDLDSNQYLMNSLSESVNNYIYSESVVK